MGRHHTRRTSRGSAGNPPVITLPAYGPDDARTLRSHLSLLHGMYVGDVKETAGLAAAHEDSHSDPDPHFVMKHEHEDEPELASPDLGETWVW